MSNQIDDRERLRQLRDRQLRARDPRSADRRTHRTVAKRRGRRQKRVTITEMFTDVPAKWKGLFLGVLAGAAVWIALPLLFEGTWPGLVGLASLPVLAILGFIIGQAFQMRDELVDLTRRK
jgi:hypothetical protein